MEYSDRGEVKSMGEMYGKEFNSFKEELKKIGKTMKTVIKSQEGLVKKVKKAQAAFDEIGKAIAKRIPKELK